MKKLDVTYDASNLGDAFTAYQYAQSSPEAIYLEDLSGWDEDSNMVFETEPKLAGPGSYLISTQVDERIVEVMVNTKFSSQAQLNAFREKLRNSMLSVKTCILVRTYTAAGSPTRKEELRGNISSISRWDQVGDICSIRFSVLCTNPTITIS